MKNGLPALACRVMKSLAEIVHEDEHDVGLLVCGAGNRGDAQGRYDDCDNFTKPSRQRSPRSLQAAVFRPASLHKHARQADRIFSVHLRARRTANRLAASSCRPRQTGSHLRACGPRQDHRRRGGHNRVRQVGRDRLRREMSCTPARGLRVSCCHWVDGLPARRPSRVTHRQEEYR